jgi:predicted AAA+ superfamily ATPase
MKPWREIAVPHRDVLEGTFQQSEFAADITAVNTGKATREYQEAVAFFDRTVITEGMRLLLIQVVQRLAGKAGEPVIQLQTAFGGGKTHTMLAVYHLATRKCALSELAGIPSVLGQADIKDVPQAHVAVLDGSAHAPGQSWKRGKQAIKTLWGELAWQLGGSEAFALVKDADLTGTSPGKDVLRDLLERHAPCVVLIDELVAYIRQFPEGETLSGGTYDSNLSFTQALTEAAKLVPTAIVLASLPESDVEAGSQRGVAALRALEKTFGRIQALWKPVATEEAFEIVRRRLFEVVRETKPRDAVCRAFADAYIAEGSKLPSETQERRYYDRLTQPYPIHPEVFDRLYEDWTTIEGFQRTRGVLKLMAKVIFRLWKDDNKDFIILPGSIPLHDGNCRNELVYYLPAGWDPVIERDIDGDRAETTELENKEPRFGQLNAARRVARTLFLHCALFGSHHARYPRARPLSRSAGLPAARADLCSVLRRTQSSRRQFALSQQFRRQSARNDKVLVRYPRQPAARDGRPFAADQGTLSRLRDAAREVLAWASIVHDVKEGRLNVDQLQEKQAEKELKTAEDVLPRAARECYRWLLCPVQETPTEPRPSVEAFPLNTTGGSLGSEVEHACVDNELIITTWSPIHLRSKLKELYWKEGQPSAKAMAFWEDTLRYLYLPRLKNREVLAHAIHTGAASGDFFGTAYGQSGDAFEGFELKTARVQFDDTLLLIEPDAAKRYGASQAKSADQRTQSPDGGGADTSPGRNEVRVSTAGTWQPRALSFHGMAEVPSATARCG